MVSASVVIALVTGLVVMKAVTKNNAFYKGTIDLSTEKITLGALMYLVGGESMRKGAGPLVQLGMKDPSMKIEVTTVPKGVQLSARGKLLLTGNGACSNPIMCFLQGAADGLVLAPSAAMLPNNVKAEIAIKLLSITISDKNKVYMRDAAGDGPSIFAKVEYLNGIVESSAGVRLPLSVCVRDCQSSTKAQSLQFEGEVGLALSAVSTVAYGSLSLTAPWWLAIVPFFHVLTGKILFGVDLKVCAMA